MRALNLFANFDKNGKVTLASNHRLLRDGNAGKYTESESLYSLLLEDGPVLAFNTWNDVLTPFVDPVNPWTAPNALYKDGAGMAGDHNFAIVSYKDDEILLRGERHSGNVRLTKCSVDWKDYIAQSDAMRDYVSSVSIPNYYVITEKASSSALQPAKIIWLNAFWLLPNSGFTYLPSTCSLPVKKW